MMWTKAKIGDCCEITSSKRIFFSEYVESGIPFYRSKEIIELSNCQEISDPLYISESKYDEIAHKFGIPQPGDMLLTSVGTIGIPYIVKEKDTFYFKDGNLTWFRNFNEGLDSRYLFYWVKSAEGQGVLNNTTIGSSQKALTIAALKDLKILCPPIGIQNRIVEILTSYDDLIENNQKQIKLLEEAAQRLYKEWFVDLCFPGHENTKITDGIPEGWSNAAVTDLLEIKYGKDHKALEDGLIPVYGSGGLVRKVNKKLHSGESVLIPRKGSLNNLLLVNGDFWAIDTMFFGVPRKPNVAKYVYLFLSGLDMYAMNIGAAVPSMTVKILEGMRVLYPVEDVLEQFEKMVGPLFLLIELLKKKRESLADARDLLLSELMSGELEV